MTVDPVQVLNQLEHAMKARADAAKSERKMTMWFIALAVVSGILLISFLVTMIVVFRTVTPVTSFSFQDEKGNVRTCTLDEATNNFVCKTKFRTDLEQPLPPVEQTAQ